MKYLKYSTWILILFITVSSLPQSRIGSNDSEGSAELRISTTKSEYLLGEPVRLERLLVKIWDPDRVGFPDDDLQGALRVFIAKGHGEFRQYKWGGYSPDREYTDGPGRLKVLRTILFNRKPRTEGLSDYGRREAENGMILTDYAFPEPGEYRIKASRGYAVRRGSDRYASSARAESNEITIRVKEPEGDDLRVWEIMKADTRIGFFMTVGEAPTGYPWTSGDIHDRSLQTERVLQEVDRITSEYPDSYLAGLLKVKAQEHRARRERIRQENEQERLKKEKEKVISASRKN